MRTRTRSEVDEFSITRACVVARDGMRDSENYLSWNTRELVRTSGKRRRLKLRFDECMSLSDTDDT